MPVQPQTNWGPVNLTQGNGAFFTAEFYDANGFVTIPSGATVNVTYINTSNTTTTDFVSLAQTGSFFTGTWSSVLANLGLATWVLFATGNSTSVQTGQIRVIVP
jgi:hypothetical protein